MRSSKQQGGHETGEGEEREREEREGGEGGRKREGKTSVPATKSRLTGQGHPVH
jgi:hypothetical protein